MCLHNQIRLINDLYEEMVLNNYQKKSNNESLKNINQIFSKFLYFLKKISTTCNNTNNHIKRLLKERDNVPGSTNTKFLSKNAEKSKNDLP